MIPSRSATRRSRKTASARRMRDSCVVEYTTGARDANDELIYTTRFTSKCRIKDLGFADADQRVADRREVTGATQIHLPWDAPLVYQDDRIRITAVGPTTPARLMGKAFIVGSDHDSSDATATRLNVKEAP